MADIIQLLPDAIANQIAAGEVVQRPASLVKELLENSIDAGALFIKLLIKEAGKQLVQVIDNGCGMSATDARMSFERHATSKIHKTEDLSKIRTLGFRGEALASIAAVAQVDLKTRKADEDLGTHIIIEGSHVVKQEWCEIPAGTQFMVKNLFYNVPARRKFLKSNTVELRHILDEFQRIAIAHPEIHFEVYHNGKEMYHLKVGPLRKRIVTLFGKSLNEKIVPVREKTEWCKIEGFIGKPQAVKRTRGEQYFLVNGRFIKSPYLNHAILASYENIIPLGSYPFYALNLSIDPEYIDVNVHPTKQEIKFEDEKLVYNIVKAAIRHALSHHNITPSLDFDQNPTLANIPLKSRWGDQDKIIIPSSFSRTGDTSLQGWEKLYDGLEKNTVKPDTDQSDNSPLGMQDSPDKKEPYQIHQSYIVSQIKSGFLLIDQQFAHERILFEQYLAQINGQTTQSQRLLFPKTLTFSIHEVAMLETILPDLQSLGFEIEPFGNETFILHGVPAHLSNLSDEVGFIHDILEQYQLNVDLKISEVQKIALSLARSSGIKRGKTLTSMEMELLIDQLFACEVPFQSPSGKKCFLTFDLDQLKEKFNN
jgi:DNA mismatch repair protein MutL